MQMRIVRVAAAMATAAAVVSAQAPRDVSLVIANGIVVTMDSAGRVLQNGAVAVDGARSEEHTSELQSQSNLVCRLLLEKKNKGEGAIGLRRLLHAAGGPRAAGLGAERAVCRLRHHTRVAAYRLPRRRVQ